MLECLNRCREVRDADAFLRKRLQAICRDLCRFFYARTWELHLFTPWAQTNRHVSTHARDLWRKSGCLLPVVSPDFVEVRGDLGCNCIDIRPVLIGGLHTGLPMHTPILGKGGRTTTSGPSPFRSCIRRLFNRCYPSVKADPLVAPLPGKRQNVCSCAYYPRRQRQGGNSEL